MERLKKENIEFLKRHVQKMLQKWRKEISKNIVGIHFGNKEKDNSKKRTYAIVFHVKQKLKQPIKKIPEYIEIKMENGEFIKIPTDVIQTGQSKLLSLCMGDKAKTSETDPSDYGTAGLFMKKANNYYVCSNMHVLAPQFLLRGSIEIPTNKQKLNVRIFNSDESAFAYLEKASFRSIDLAIARIDRPSLITNRIRSIGNISGAANINALRRGDRVRIFGATSGSMEGVITNLNIARHVEYDGKETIIPDLIAINCNADFGDSGSPVVLKRNNAVIGLLVSMDDLSVYLINIDSIKFFTKAQLIINQNATT